MTKDVGVLDNGLASVLKIVEAVTGQDFSSCNVNTVARHIEQRMAMQNVSELRQYLDLLDENPHEPYALSQGLLIEQLRFANSELAATKEELQGRVDELDHTNNYLDNLFDSLKIASVILDSNHNIKSFTPAIADILNLTESDIDKPFIQFAEKINWSTFSHDVETVLAGNSCEEREFTLPETKRCYLIRALPYSTAHQRIENIVIHLIDISGHKQAEEATRSAALFPLENPNPVMRVSRNGSVLFYNRVADPILAEWRGSYENGFPDAFLQNIEKSLTTGVVLDFDLKVFEREITFSLIPFPERDYVNIYGRDTTEMKRAEQSLLESENRIRLKLEKILSPEGDLENLELEDIIDVDAIQSLMNNFYLLTQIPISIIDLKGKVLVGAGWQDICTKFHRIHKETCKHCTESDIELTSGISAGEFRLYKCKNNMWDVATPLMVGGRKLGNLFSGQFFFDDEKIDYDFFKSQAQKYNFDEAEYIAALERVTRFSREKLTAGLDYFVELADLVAKLSYANLKLARSLAERDSLTELLQQSKERLSKAQEIAHLGSWELNLLNNKLFWSDEVYRILGIDSEQSDASYELFLETVHPDDRSAVNAAYLGSLNDGVDNYEIEHRVVRKSDGAVRFVHEKCDHHRDDSGRVVRSFGMVHDITDRKKSENALKESYARIDLLAQAASSLLGSDSPQSLVDSLCHRVMELLDCQAFFNFLVDKKAGRLRLNACAGISEEEVKLIEWLDYGVAVCGTAARDACRIVAEDIFGTPDPRTELVKSYGIQAYACHPLIAYGRVLGTLSFGTTTRSAFNDDELDMMKAVADMVAIAMERKHFEELLQRANDGLEHQVKERTEELVSTVNALQLEVYERITAEESLLRLNRLYALLSETNQIIVRAGDRETLFREFCRAAVEQGGFLLSWVGLLDSQSGHIQMTAASGRTDYLDDIRVSIKDEPQGLGPTGISVRDGSYYICNDFQNDPCTRPWHEKGRMYGIGSSASVALKEEGRVVGSLALYAEEKGFFDKQPVELLLQMGADLSFALDNFCLEARRREVEQALQEETQERLRTVEALKEKEQLLVQQSRLAAMGEMIGNIAHQWRQPLNLLALKIQQMQVYYENGLFSNEFLEETVTKSMTQIKHMSQTIDDFRNYFIPDREKTEFSPYEIITAAFALLQDGFKHQHIALEMQRSGLDEHLIFGFPNEYSQALMNILFNAKDALQERKPLDPKVTVTIMTENGRSVVLINDNAGGIPEDIIEKIFDPYFTTKGPQDGTGVGLFMSRTIIEKNMQGRLSVRNTADGAEFRIEV